MDCTIFEKWNDNASMAHGWSVGFISHCLELKDENIEPLPLETSGDAVEQTQTQDSARKGPPKRRRNRIQ